MCEEYGSLHDRSGRHDIVMGQSIVLGANKTEVPLDCDGPTNQDLLFPQYGERIEKISGHDKLSKFCMDAGCLNVVEIGQYFMTKDTGDLTQCHAVACREYTLPWEDDASQPKGWIQRNTKIGPVLKVTTSCLHCKYGVEISISSLNGENTHSWARNSHGSNEFVMDSNNSDTNSEVGCEIFCIPLKGKSKTTKKKTCWLIIWNQSDEQKDLDWYWTRATFSICVGSLEESDSSSSSFSASTSRRGWSGSFLENKRKSPERIHTVYSLFWRSMESMLGSRRRREKKIPVLYWCSRNNNLFRSSSTTLRKQSYWSFIAGQCCNSERILPTCFSYWMCIHSSFYHQLWINTCRSKFEQETDSILPACWSCGKKS